MSQARTLRDWTEFFVVSLAWSSAFAFNRVAVQTLPPSLIIPGRLTIGAIVLIIVMKLSGQSFPRLTARREWLFILLLGTFGTALPFFLVTTAQKTIDSSLAALFVTTSPLIIVAVAHFIFKDERMTRRKALGVAIGFIGVGVLFGPDAINNYDPASLTAQGLCFLGAIGYTASTLLARAAPPLPPFVMAAGFITVGALASLPMAFTTDWSSVHPSLLSIIAVIALGIIPTAAAAIIYMSLVQRTDATFVSLTSYAIPLFAMIIGWLAFRETQSWYSLIAFVLILSGVWLAQRRRRYSSSGITG